ncbi:hypothetical protein [Halospeciosus flavus]|uniref:hypothetical protein n=1 Tax=Halospeciosus flavus TaxID=3032283 RepID=UPI003621AA3B
MSSKEHVFKIYLLVYIILGVTIGLFGHLSAKWAQYTYITAASGPTVETMGPILVGLVIFQNIAVSFLIGIVLAFLVGIILGSNLETSLQRYLFQY